MVTPSEVDTMQDRVDAMKILSAGNTIMMITLGAILALQVSAEHTYTHTHVRLASMVQHHSLSQGRETYPCGAS